MDTGSRFRRGLAALALGLAPGLASASFMQGETLDSFAMGLAWFIVIALPIGGVIVFWKLHILPEKFAEKRHPPAEGRDPGAVSAVADVRRAAVAPIAWLWAYTRPTGTYMAYGTEKHEDYFHEMNEKWRAGKLSHEEAEELRDELEGIASRARLPRKLKALLKDLEAAAPAPGAAARAGGAA